MSLVGEQNITLDAQNRISIPKKFRDDLGENFYLFRAVENCIAIYTEERWDEILDEVNKQTNTPENRNKKRKILSRVCPTKMDKQGRVTLNERMIEHAKIVKDAVVVGMGNCIEIWCAEDWYKLENETDDSDLATGINF